MKKLSLLSILLSSIFMFQGCDDKPSTDTQLKADKVYTLSAGTTSGEYYQKGHILGKIMSEKGFSFKIVSSEGGEQNARRVFNGITDFGFVQKDTHNLLSTIDGNYSNKVNVVSLSGEESVLFIINKNSDIKTEDDIKNNKVKIAITSKSSGTNSTLDTMGKINKNFTNKEIVYKDFNQAINELNTKTIDVLMIVQSSKNGYNENIKKIMNENNLDIIDIKDSVLVNNKINGKKVYNQCKFDFKNKLVDTICTETLLISKQSIDQNLIDSIKNSISFK